MSFPKPYADQVAKLRVFFGFLLVATFIWFSKPDATSLTIGLPIALAGLAIRAWAAGHLRKNLNLTDSGPYAHVRNPLYIGTATCAAGFVVASKRWELGVLFAAVFLLVYLPVVELEEQHLRSLFPAYADYAKNVPKLFPKLNRPVRKGGGNTFAWSQYRHNREYEALGGFLLGVAILCYKAFYL